MDRETPIRAAVNLLAAAAPEDNALWSDAIVLEFLALVDPDRNAYRVDKIIRSAAHKPMASHLRELKAVDHLQQLPDLLPLLEAHILKWPDSPNRQAALRVCRSPRPFDLIPTDPDGRIFHHTAPQAATEGSEVCFTGFGDERRFILERSARVVGLKVVPKVTVHLRYLCTGPTAGPAKLRKAEEQGVRIVGTEEDLQELLESGTLA